jgi:uncharacterized membrane protein (UPF0127 family)
MTVKANTSEKRRTGLLKHESLPKGEALWIAPCEAVHSFWMKFAIDVIYLNKHKRVLKIRRNMVPWRISGCLTAHSVLEVPAGMAEETRTERGDQLVFENQRAAEEAPQSARQGSAARSEA